MSFVGVEKRTQVAVQVAVLSALASTSHIYCSSFFYLFILWLHVCLEAAPRVALASLVVVRAPLEPAGRSSHTNRISHPWSIRLKMDAVQRNDPAQSICTLHRNTTRTIVSLTPPSSPGTPAMISGTTLSHLIPPLRTQPE